MKLILLNCENGNYTIENVHFCTDDYDIFELDEPYWDEDYILKIYSKNKDKEKNIQKLKDFAIEYHKNCIDKLSIN